MRLIPSDPDLATIASRIERGDLNLQPSFQRGEVWSTSKKQRLIDSVLRDWHVPPIHVIELADSKKQEVLDGQQRLVAIRDFMRGEIVVDGDIEPRDEAILALDGCRYQSLPPEWRRRFDQFTIRVFKITDYAPGEPFELFYRLNQPSNLTAAEQRNAFFGPARQQVKQLVDLLEENRIDRDFVGFSNARMAYDDVLARLCCSSELGTLAAKVTAYTLTEKYRSKEPFSQLAVSRSVAGIRRFAQMRRFTTHMLKLNKATLFSWLWFTADTAQFLTTEHLHLQLANFLMAFEEAREMSIGHSQPLEIIAAFDQFAAPLEIVSTLVDMYNDRASARVADVSSVMTRDVVLWVMFALFSVRNNVQPFAPPPKNEAYRLAARQLKEPRDVFAAVQQLLNVTDWGAPL